MPRKKSEADYLTRIIDLCRTVAKKGLNPFEVEVRKILGELRERLPYWKLPEEYCLDAEALREIVEIIWLQKDWIRHMSSSLYVDYLLMNLKLRILDIKSLAYALLSSWHPIASIRQISSSQLREAIEYWNQLLPLEERTKRITVQAVQPGFLDLRDLFRLGLLSKEEFEEVLRRFWEELKERAKGKKLSYWDFICADTFEESAMRAYMASFLATYGYSTLEEDPLSKEIYMIPFEEPRKQIPNETSYSFPIALHYSAWKERRLRGGENERKG